VTFNGFRLRSGNRTSIRTFVVRTVLLLSTLGPTRRGPLSVLFPSNMFPQSIALLEGTSVLAPDEGDSRRLAASPTSPTQTMFTSRLSENSFFFLHTTHTAFLVQLLVVSGVRVGSRYVDLLVG